MPGEFFKFSAGKFRIESSTHGHPCWTSITYEDGRDGCLIRSIHHSEIKDLIYAAKRMRKALKHALNEFGGSEGGLGHELD